MTHHDSVSSIDEKACNVDRKHLIFLIVKNILTAFSIFEKVHLIKVGDKMTTIRIIVTDSSTKIDADAEGTVVVTASHGGVYSAYLVASLGVRATIFNDAGVGKDNAGIAGLQYLQDFGIPAAAIGHETARIGDGKDMMERGVIRHVNDLACSLGCKAGMSCRETATLLEKAQLVKVKPKLYVEARHLVIEGKTEAWCLDSASLVLPEDRNRIVITGSHGGVLGGRAETALKFDAVAALFNDAGMGMDKAGISRLAVLDNRNIAAATVSSESARIGDARSTYLDGILSAVNGTAENFGGEVGMLARNFVEMIVRQSK